jgi:hypothetical protein
VQTQPSPFFNAWRISPSTVNPDGITGISKTKGTGVALRLLPVPF